MDGEDKQEEEEEVKPRPEVKRPQIIHKSSKELYKAVAAQWGITCKMSDHCRCLDCQVCQTFVNTLFNKFVKNFRLLVIAGTISECLSK